MRNFSINLSTDSEFNIVCMCNVIFVKLGKTVLIMATLIVDWNIILQVCPLLHYVVIHFAINNILFLIFSNSFAHRLHFYLVRNCNSVRVLYKNY